MNCADCSHMAPNSIFRSVGFCEKYFKEVNIDSSVRKECFDSRTKVPNQEEESLVEEQKPAQIVKIQTDMKHTKTKFIDTLSEEDKDTLLKITVISRLKS